MSEIDPVIALISGVVVNFVAAGAVALVVKFARAVADRWLDTDGDS